MSCVNNRELQIRCVEPRLVLAFALQGTNHLTAYFNSKHVTSILEAVVISY
jgi:hypothetical protein